MYLAYSFPDLASEENASLIYMGTSRSKMIDAIQAAIKKDAKIQKIVRFDNPVGVRHPLNSAPLKKHTPEEIAAFRAGAKEIPISAQDKVKAEAEAKKKSDAYEIARKEHVSSVAKTKAEADLKAKELAALKKAA